MESVNRALAVDCGSYKTVISDKDGRIILDELSLVYQTYGDVSFVGNRVPLVHGKGEEVAPLVEYENGGKYLVKKMWSYFIEEAAGKVLGIFRPNPEIMLAIPLNAYAYRVKYMASSIYLRKLSYIEQPIAAARGLGKDVVAEMGNMIVDIGHLTTDIAVISQEKVICSSTIPYAGKRFNEDIQHFLLNSCGLVIGESTSQRVKHEVGAAIPDLPKETIPKEFFVRGANVERSGWQEATISHEQIASCIDFSLNEIESEINKILQQIPEDVYKDFSEKGIWLIGGSSELRGIDLRFSKRIGIPFRIPEDPSTVIARGAASLLGHC